MVIGGVWHGAGWSFLLWGAFHGLGLALLHLFKNIKLPFLLAVLVTFIYVSLLWVFFLSEDLDAALALFKILFSFEGFKEYNYWLLAVGFIVWIMPNATQIIALQKNDFGLKSWHGYLAGILFFVSLKMMAETPSLNFVYFNF